jgi:hypothetical protein
MASSTQNAPALSLAAPQPPSGPALSTQAPPPQVPTAPNPQDGTALPNNATAPPPKRSRAPRQPPTDSSTVSSLPPLLVTVSDQPLYSVQRTTPTYVIPCAITLFHILSQMDFLMASTTKFYQVTPDWIPYVSQLYIAVLFFIQTLRAQELAGSIDPIQLEFLQRMVQRYHAPNLLIPGPLVPFFQAIASSNGPTDQYGNITPGIPNQQTLGVTQNNDYRFANRINLILPNVILIMDQLIRTLQQAPLASPDDNSDRWYTNIFGVAAAAPGPVATPESFLMYSPNARSNPYCPDSQVRAFHRTGTHWLNLLPTTPGVAAFTSPYTLGANATPLNLWQILAFQGPPQVAAIANRHYSWFDKVSSVMQKYCKFFHHSVPMAALSPTGIGAIYLETQLLNDAVTAAALLGPINTRTAYSTAAPNRFDNKTVENIRFTVAHADPSLEELAEQYGVLTGINVDWTNVNANIANNALGPLRGNVFVGPISALPHERESHEMGIPHDSSSNISTYYYSSVEIKKA